MPLIYFMSWRSCRRFGQAFSETAAWVIGYLIATGALLALHYGGMGMVKATPDDPAAIVAIIGGFVGMGVSRYLWKRRGGHLEPVKNPLTDNRYFRAARAMVIPAKSKSKTRATTTRETTHQKQSGTQPANRSATAAKPAARTTNQTSKSSAQRWGRVIGAMLTPPDSQRRPPQ
jgi:hypothetical protein